MCICWTNIRVLVRLAWFPGSRNRTWLQNKWIPQYILLQLSTKFRLLILRRLLPVVLSTVEIKTFVHIFGETFKSVSSLGISWINQQESWRRLVAVQLSVHSCCLHLCLSWSSRAPMCTYEGQTIKRHKDVRSVEPQFCESDQNRFHIPGFVMKKLTFSFRDSKSDDDPSSVWRVTTSMRNWSW